MTQLSLHLRGGHIKTLKAIYFSVKILRINWPICLSVIMDTIEYSYH